MIIRNSFTSNYFISQAKILAGRNPSVSGVFIPLWQKGIKGDFRIRLVKSPLAPLFQRGV
jgi:hypothetical protein